jgi:hypothetical protein
MGFFDNIGSFFGIGGKNTGGRKDASADYRKYSDELNNLISGYREGLANNKLNDFYSPLVGSIDEIKRRSKGIADSLRNRSGTLAARLQGAAEQGLATARVDAANLARIASGGRGGLAFGGGAGALATRAASGTGANVASTMANVLLQNEQITNQNDLAAAQLELSGLGQATELQRYLYQQGIDREDRLNMAQLQALAGLSGQALGAGLQGEALTANRRFGFVSSFRLGGGSG